MSVIGEKLKELRANRGLLQSELGVVLNVAYNTVSSWERGNSNPSLEQLVLIAKFFDVTTDYLLGLED